MFGKDLRTFGSELHQSNSYAELFEIDGEPIEFEWTNFPGLASLEMLMPRQTCEVEVLNQKNTEIESFLCFCSTTSIGPRKEIQRNAFRISIKSRITKRYLLDQDTKRSGTELLVTDLMKKWDSAASSMVQRFAETGHPMFKGISALSRGILKKEAKWRHHTLQYGLVDHRTLVSYHPLSKSAQYLRSSIKLV